MLRRGNVLLFSVAAFVILAAVFIAKPGVSLHNRAESHKKDISGELAWSLYLPHLGTFSSPRVADLNGDGVGDIIVGMGRLEFQATDTAVVALDGKLGTILWSLPASDHIFGSALLMDIDGDGVQDVVIGGRSANLFAVNGKTGELIWEFAKEHLRPLIQKKYFNFYNPQLIPDQTGDGLADILVSNGGDVLKVPYDEDRPVGHLMTIDASNGHIIGEAPMPDGKETYHSIALSPGDKVEEIEVVFGTGGETVGGSLYVCGLREVLKGDLSKAIKLAESPHKGFIAPVAWVDILGDGRYSIIACGVEGTVYAFEGKTKKQLWKYQVQGTEMYASVGVGNFFKGGPLDFFITANKGFWPFFSQSTHILVEGHKGRVRFEETFGEFQTSSPLAYDVNHDGLDEVIMSVNLEGKEAERKVFTNSIWVVDFANKQKYELIPPLPGHNNSSTPWVGDLDNDGYLDVVFCHSDNLYHTYAFDGMQINMVKTNIPIRQPVKWGAYMGSRYDGRYGTWPME
ncbi:FG-GAP-like repeat-containing protein [Negadavirga shengliensis]|uniref:FG-GAP-like repeat-containing protein n=1 Tax=Negadavirga shengliensis TaxID=1389218 RepID=A0ABV9T8W7_9BACT